MERRPSTHHTREVIFGGGGEGFSVDELGRASRAFETFGASRGEGCGVRGKEGEKGEIRLRTKKTCF